MQFLSASRKNMAVLRAQQPHFATENRFLNCAWHHGSLSSSKSGTTTSLLIMIFARQCMAGFRLSRVWRWITMAVGRNRLFCVLKSWHFPCKGSTFHYNFLYFKWRYWVAFHIKMHFHMWEEGKNRSVLRPIYLSLSRFHHHYETEFCFVILIETSSLLFQSTSHLLYRLASLIIDRKRT